MSDVNEHEDEFPETVTYYAIRNTVDPTDWWSNEDGWTFHVPSRDIFTEEERNTLDLPQDGEWVEADPGAGEFDEEFPDEHSHVPDFWGLPGQPNGANVFACDDEGRHYHLQISLTVEGIIIDVYDRYGEECLATWARTFDELVDFVFANDPMLLFQPEPLLRNFQVGNLYEFQAEDENHAIEQYRDAMTDVEPTDVNYVHEIPREEPPEPVVTRCPLCRKEHRADWTCAKAAAASSPTSSSIRAARELMNELETQEATVSIFIRNGAQWVMVAGELFGPYTDYYSATAALPEILRGLE